MREVSNSAYYRWSVNCLICSDPALQQGPLFYGAVARSTTADDFTDFIGDAIAAGWLRAGKVLVLDNAHQHHQAADDLEAICTVMGIDILWLPRYCNELNPIELVWSKVSVVY